MVDPPKDLSHHDWPWLIGTLVLSALTFLGLATWSALACARSLPGDGGCLTNHFGTLLWMLLSLIAVIVCSVHMARLHPHIRSRRSGRGRARR